MHNNIFIVRTGPGGDASISLYRPPLTDYILTGYTLTGYTLTDYTLTDYTLTDYTLTGYTLTGYTLTNYTLTDYTLPIVRFIRYRLFVLSDIYLVRYVDSIIIIIC